MRKGEGLVVRNCV